MLTTPIDIEALYGTWRMVESRAFDSAGTRLADPWGPEPMGRLVLTRSGRMMAVLCDGRTDVPAGEARAYSSYCGNFVVDGNLLVTTIDAASDVSRIGSKQPRQIAMRDGRLVLMPPRTPTGEQREIIWEFEAPPA
jgi:Lipocalin-like domain